MSLLPECIKWLFRHREELEELLRNITMERASILNALVWCMEHADGAQEVLQHFVCKLLNSYKTSIVCREWMSLSILLHVHLV